MYSLSILWFLYYLYLATYVCNVYFILHHPAFGASVASLRLPALIVKLHSLRVDRCGGATLAFLLVAAPRGRPHFLIQFVIAVHCTGRLAARFVPTARNFFPLKTAQGTSFFGLNVKCEPIWSKLGVCYTGVFVLWVCCGHRCRLSHSKGDAVRSLRTRTCRQVIRLATLFLW